MPQMPEIDGVGSPDTSGLPPPELRHYDQEREEDSQAQANCPGAKASERESVEPGEPLAMPGEVQDEPQDRAFESESDRRFCVDFPGPRVESPVNPPGVFEPFSSAKPLVAHGCQCQDDL